MNSPYAISCSLLCKLVFFTAKSARQTTPNLIKNPKLTVRGIAQPTPKSYAYALPEGLPNRHLYWNNTEQNRLRRRNYNAHRLYKLGIRPIHDQQGAPLHNRTLEEVLYELANLKLIKASFGRTLVNLREVVERFPEAMKGEGREVVVWALEQIDQRSLPSLNHFDFSTYCYLRSALRVPPTQRLIFHIYKWVEAEVERPTGKFKPKYFLANIRYAFDQPIPEALSDILIKKVVEFKLFEDLEPSNKPLEELLPRLFSDTEIKALKEDSSFKLSKMQFLSKIPGGKGLLYRLQKL